MTQTSSHSTLAALAAAAVCLLLLAVSCFVLTRRFAGEERLVGSTAKSVTVAPVGIANPAQLTIEVTGRDYGWRYRFPGRDGEFNTEDDIQVSDELHLPLDCDIKLLVKSDDYVYTLSIPALELRRIAIPELVYTLDFCTSKSGCFEVVADPLCSVRLFHDEDMGRVVIESLAEFDRWYRSVQ